MIDVGRRVLVLAPKLPFARLSAEQRDVILMRYAADLSFAEIATTLKKKEPAIRMLLHRGLRKLKAVMDEE